MNTRLSLNLICNFPLKKQRGFALAFALTFGIVTALVAITMIIRAQGDQSKVTSQLVTNQAAAIAEAGATQYINFLNKNRGLIAYDSCVALDATTGACSDSTTSTTVDSWVSAGASNGNLTGISNTGTTPTSVSGSSNTSCSSSAGGSGGTPPASYQSVSSTTISNLGKNSTSSGSTSGWTDTPDGKAQYRLVSYKVTRTNASDPTTTTSGTLTVEGRVNQSGTGASATDRNNTGKARMQFVIPVTAKQVTATGGSSSSTGFPGLWAQNFNFGSNNSANAQVWDSSACGTSATAMPDARILDYTSQDRNVLPSNPLTLASGITDTPSANNGNNKLYNGTVYRTSSSVANPLPKVMKSQAFPNLPSVSGTDAATYPTSSTPKLVYGPSTTETGTITENAGIDSNSDGVLDGIDCSPLSNVTFPRSGDVSSTNVAYGTAPANATYVYRCAGGMSIGGSAVTLGRTGNETIVFYVNGTFNASANGGIFPVQDTTDQSWSRGIFYVKNDAQVKANGNVGRLLAPFAIQFYVYNSGNMNPGYDMGGNGSLYAFVFAPTSIGLSKGTEDLAGALWIKSYEVDGNNKVWQAIFDDTKLMVQIPTGGTVTSYSLDSNPTSVKRVPVQ